MRVKWGQSSNIDDHLRSLGFGEQPALIKSYDANLAVGGPILRDRVWFYANSRAIGTYQEQQNLYDNLNAGNPNSWTWARNDALSVRNCHLQDAERRAPDVAGHARKTRWASTSTTRRTAAAAPTRQAAISAEVQVTVGSRRDQA